jgi:hypothetical protein
MAVNIKTMFFWDMTACIWLMETNATEKPVYQTVQPHIPEDHSLEDFVRSFQHVEKLHQ